MCFQDIESVLQRLPKLDSNIFNVYGSPHDKLRAINPGSDLTPAEIAELTLYFSRNLNRQGAYRGIVLGRIDQVIVVSSIYEGPNIVRLYPPTYRGGSEVFISSYERVE